MINKTSEQQTAYEGWSIVELMGHNTIAGFVSEQTIAGVAMLRIDVPQVDEDHPAFTKFVSGSAIYGITPTTEDIALHAAAKLRVRPISPYVVPVPPANRQLVDSYGEPGENDHDWNDVDDDVGVDIPAVNDDEDEDEDEIGF